MRQKNKVLLDKKVVVHVQDNALKDYYLYENLYKAKSSLAMQLRTKKIGFNAFLVRQRVLNVSSNCTCKHPD